MRATALFLNLGQSEAGMQPVALSVASAVISPRTCRPGARAGGTHGELVFSEDGADRV